MEALRIDERYRRVLEGFGDVQEAVQEAVRRFIIDKFSERIEHCRKEIEHFEWKYGCMYEQFVEKIGTDDSPGFIKELDNKQPFWEADFNLWETYVEELEDWRERVREFLTA